jgi:hypothetical protein
MLPSIGATVRGPERQIGQSLYRVDVHPIPLLKKRGIQDSFEMLAAEMKIALEMGVSSQPLIGSMSAVQQVECALLPEYQTDLDRIDRPFPVSHYYFFSPRHLLF